jgi:hypothetical protein
MKRRKRENAKHQHLRRLLESSEEPAAQACLRALRPELAVELEQRAPQKALEYHNLLSEWAGQCGLPVVGFEELKRRADACDMPAVAMFTYEDESCFVVVCATMDLGHLIGCAMIGKSPSNPLAPPGEDFVAQTTRVFEDVMRRFHLRVDVKGHTTFGSYVVLASNAKVGLRIVRDHREATIDVELLLLDAGGCAIDSHRRVTIFEFLRANGVERRPKSWGIYYPGAVEVSLNEHAEVLREHAAGFLAGDLTAFERTIESRRRQAAERGS